MNQKSHQQKLEVTTIVKLDFVDSLKVLFGRALKIKTTFVVPQEEPIKGFNHYASTEIVPTTTYFTKQNKPHFGYSPKHE
jgi:hypothetical protein